MKKSHAGCSRNSPHDGKGYFGVLRVQFVGKLLADDSRIEGVDAAVTIDVAMARGPLEKGVK